MTSALTEADRGLPVTTIRVTIHTTGLFFESDTRSGNHASIFLIVGPNTSVRLNMIKANPTDTMGTYTETLCRYVNSTSSLHNINLVAASGVTVRTFVDYIHNMNMQKYRLAPSGVGCRFWVNSAIQRFEAAGFIDPSSPVNGSRVTQELQYNYSRDKSPELEPIVPGTFV